MSGLADGSRVSRGPIADRARGLVTKAIPRQTQRYIGIAAALAWAEIRRDASRNFAGLFWWLADPLVNLAVYYFVFTYVFKPTSSNFVLFLLLNLMVWRWLSATVARASSSLINATPMIRQVYLPKAVFPLEMLFTEALAFGVGFVIVVVVAFIGGPGLHRTMLFVPLLALVTAAHIYTLGVLVSIVAPYLPDSTPIVGFGLRALSMVSGVFFDPAALGPRFERLIYLNPWAGLLDCYRALVIRGSLPAAGRLGYVVGITVVTLPAAIVLHVLFDRSIPKALQ